jgi:glutamate racemase
MVLRRGEKEKPIGIFDSGLGGLTVLKALFKEVPHENTVYLGDTARVPYGTKSAETVVRYSLQNTAFLVGRGIKLLVVACNTSSAAALPELTRRYDIPVVGVILPGARAAVRESEKGPIGVIGTRGTINSGAYERSIKKISPSARVISRPCPLFVSLAEEGWVDNEVARKTAEEYLTPLKNAGIDTILLGCTHYPLLEGVIGESLGPDVRLIDSATETAREVRRLLDETGLCRDSGIEGQREFFVTDLPDHFWEVGRRFLGESLENVSQVDLNIAGDNP